MMKKRKCEKLRRCGKTVANFRDKFTGCSVTNVRHSPLRWSALNLIQNDQKTRLIDEKHNKVNIHADRDPVKLAIEMFLFCVFASERTPFVSTVRSTLRSRRSICFDYNCGSETRKKKCLRFKRSIPQYGVVVEPDRIKTGNVRIFALQSTPNYKHMYERLNFFSTTVYGYKTHLKIQTFT